jgi:hypothetical protein
MINNLHFENARVKAIVLSYTSPSSSEKLSFVKLENDNDEDEVVS